MTASSSGSLRVSARSVATWLTPYFTAASLVLSSSRPISEIVSTPSISLIASRCLKPKAPAPASATLIVLGMRNLAYRFALSFPTAAKRTIGNPELTPAAASWIPGQTFGPPGMTRSKALRGILQDEMTDRRVGRRDMIEPVRDFRLGAARDHLRHRPSRDQPHHKFDAFGSRLADIFDVGRLRQALWVIDQPVEKFVVPLLVDEPCARPLKLMAHAARAPDMDVDVFGIAHDRAA